LIALASFNRSKLLMPQSTKADQNPLEIAAEGGLDARFCEVMDGAPVMIWVSGKDKGCVWFNKPWLTFTGRRLVQEVREGWSEGVHRDDLERCIKAYSNHFDARKDFRIQYRLRRHDGAYRWIDDTGIPRFARDGIFLGYIGSCIDIQEHREIQSELRRRLLDIAELNRQAEAAILSASVAHEIRQPLMAIVANASAGLRWLGRETPDVEKGKACLNNVAQAGQRAGAIIDSILATNKKENRTRAPLNLNELIQEALALLETEVQSYQIAVRTTLNKTIPEVPADRVQLQQVMVNLIENAIEAMSHVADDSRVLHLKTELDGARNILITVEDSGPGIDPNIIERIFGRFFTTKTEGMGMGLAICRSIIEAHNGRLWAEAGDDQGSIFRISLPVA
jgi:PAS domain S-box-containing protein